MTLKEQDKGMPAPRCSSAGGVPGQRCSSAGGIKVEMSPGNCGIKLDPDRMNDIFNGHELSNSGKFRS